MKADGSESEVRTQQHTAGTVGQQQGEREPTSETLLTPESLEQRGSCLKV